MLASVAGESGAKLKPFLNGLPQESIHRIEITVAEEPPVNHAPSVYRYELTGSGKFEARNVPSDSLYPTGYHGVEIHEPSIDL